MSSLLTPLKKTPEQGAFPSVYMATSPDVEGINGKFFDKTKFVTTKPVTRDEALQERLWQVSLEQLGLELGRGSSEGCLRRVLNASFIRFSPPG